MMNWLKDTPGRFFLVIALLAAGMSAAYAVSSEVIPGSRAAELENCVADTQDMRRNHMSHLLHKRDQTMRQGIRTEAFSLTECVACHAARDNSGQFVPISDDGQFCQTCHVRVAEKLDCFQCHRTTPESH